MTKKEQKVKMLTKIKYEVAKELGMEDEIKKKGWGGLTSREAGRIGGHVVKHLSRYQEKDLK